MKIFLVCVAAFILALMVETATPGGAGAQRTRSVTREQVDAALPKLQEYIEKVMMRTAVPGVAVAVVFEDKVVFLEGFGVRDAGKTDAVTPDTVFQIASVSKAVAATVVATVVSDGIIEWDSRISDLDPGFELYDAYPSSEVTVRDLFSHRSGLPGNAGNELEELGYTRDEISRRLRYMPPEYSFRAGYSYSNHGLTEGALAAVKPTGKSWEDASRARLYEPLGMTHTSSSNADFIQEGNRSALHVRVGGKWQAFVTRQPDAQSPAGGVSSTARDLAQFMRLQLGRGTVEGETLIKPAAFDAIHTPIIYRGVNPLLGTSFYALGWNTTFKDGRTYWTHNGAFSVGARTILTVMPEEQLGIVVLTNAFPTGLPESISTSFFDMVHYGEPRGDYFTMAEDAFKNLLPYEALKAAFATPPAAMSPALDNAAYVGTYESDYIGMATVRAEGDGLVLVVGPKNLEYPLRHWNRDVFLSYPVAEDPEVPSPVVFTIGADGKASHVLIEELNTNGQGVLERVADK